MRALDRLRQRRDERRAPVDPDLPRACRRTQTHLPRVVADEASWLLERRVRRHLDDCAVCRAELDRQVALGSDLRSLAPQRDLPPPPDDLLDALLARAREPDLRARMAAPARGAVSGARPGLTIASLVAVAIVAGVVGYGSWRLGRWLARTLDDD